MREKAGIRRFQANSALSRARYFLFEILLLSVQKLVRSGVVRDDLRMGLRKGTSPGEIVSAIIVLAGVAGLVWAAMNGYVPAGIVGIARHVVGFASLVVLLGVALLIGHGVNRLFGVDTSRPSAG